MPLENDESAAAIESLIATRAYCGRCAEVLKQIVDLGNINEETRKILRHLGNGLNDTARAGLPNAIVTECGGKPSTAVTPPDHPAR